MSTIVTRTSKGSALTWAEADANFTNLNVDKVEYTRLDDTDGASLVGFIQAGIGAVASTAQSKSRLISIDVEDFGAVSGLSAVPTTNDTAFAAAFAYAKLSGAKVVNASAQYYVLSAKLNVPDGVTIIGSGVGFWDCVYHNRDKGWQGTSLIFKGTGTRDQSFYGITSMQDAGGVRTVTAVSCKLTSFMNSDSVASATRATKRNFSVAIGPETSNGGSHWGLKDLRIVPWMGVDGVTDYSNEANVSLGDDWDIGVSVQDSEYVTLSNVQVVGYWRLAGLAQINPGLDAYGFGERNRYYDCKFQGYVGVLIRASDRWTVSATTVNTVTVKHNDQQYWPTSGSFESTQLSSVHTYSGLSYAAGNLQFTGVSPDPSGTTQIRNPKRGSGVAGTQFLDCVIHGLDHVSGDVATALGFSEPSKAGEISGFPLRGIQFYNTKFQTDEAICVFLHDCADTIMFGAQFEGGGRIIASPVESSSTAVAPAGQTSALRLMSSLVSSADITAFTPRTVFDDLGAINQTWTPIFGFVAAPTYTTQLGKYIRIGNRVDFSIELAWSGLDTTDTSAIQIAIPVGSVAKHINGTINDFDSTGLILSAVTNPILRMVSNTQITIADNGGSLAYNSGKILAAGTLIISGSYWIES